MGTGRGEQKRKGNGNEEMGEGQWVQAEWEEEWEEEGEWEGTMGRRDRKGEGE